MAGLPCCSSDEEDADAESSSSDSSDGEQVKEWAKAASNSSKFRFEEDEMALFDASSEGRRLVLSCFCFSLFYMWPFQTMIQTQSFLVKAFPEHADTAGFVMMISTTFPFLVCHSLLSVTGLTRRLPYAVRMSVPPTLVFCLSLYLLCVMWTQNSGGFLLNSLYITALTVSTAEGIAEPAVYDIAGLLPSTSTSMAVQAGNGACGLIVSGIQMSARLLTSGFGPIGKNELDGLTKVFITIMALSSLCFVNIYWSFVRPSAYYSQHVKPKASAHAGNEMNEMSLVRATAKAIRQVWPSFVATILTFLVTCCLWPVIPGRACVQTSPGEQTLQSWWFDLVIFVFNLADFLGKTHWPSLNWGARVLTPMGQLALALLRIVVFVPLILTGSAPQLYSPSVARYVVLISVFFMGVTNGWLSTVCFMRAPKAFPPDTPNAVAAQASTALVLGLFMGISFGCLGAYTLGQTALHDSLGVCFGEPTSG